MSETSCPLCQRPRPRGVRRCACNYVFEYDAPARAGRTPGMAAALVGLAVVGGLAAAAWLRGEPDLGGHAAAGALLVPAGAFTVIGAIADWDWFMGARRARLLAALLGRTGARLFYALLGGGLAGVGLVLALV